MDLDLKMDLELDLDLEHELNLIWRWIWIWSWRWIVNVTTLRTLKNGKSANIFKTLCKLNNCMHSKVKVRANVDNFFFVLVPK